MSTNKQKLLRYYCMNCGDDHREIACPHCGSKAKMVGLRETKPAIYN
jgi:DNA-directed RNA polymerase subunit RPC12/RpoP